MGPILPNFHPLRPSNGRLLTLYMIPALCHVIKRRLSDDPPPLFSWTALRGEPPQPSFPSHGGTKPLPHGPTDAPFTVANESRRATFRSAKAAAPRRLQRLAPQGLAPQRQVPPHCQQTSLAPHRTQASAMQHCGQAFCRTRAAQPSLNQAGERGRAEG